MAMKRSIRSKVIVIIVILNLCEIQRTDAQLEAVGAVLSVVPVTSILATAGLVGVKLAALSRLLQALGYDRAYLAKGGAGSTDKPIGLQKNYAYMFPYVPGLNISVKDEHSPYTYSSKGAEKSTYIQQNGVAPDPIDSSGGGSTGNGPDSPHRKTYPAMGLPGDYETQTRPFRGSDILRDIFNRAGLNVALPTQEQKNAIKHKFVNIPDKALQKALIIELPDAAELAEQSSTAPIHSALSEPTNRAASQTQPQQQSGGQIGRTGK